MLKYYSYYSIGGYKDLYLGTSEMQESFTYYLPLLSIQRKNAENDADAASLEKIAQLDALPKIKLVNKANNWGLPNYGAKLISHGGYKLIFTHAEANTFVLSLRDIRGENKDESGRSIPFLMMIVADTEKDANQLATIAAYWSNHLNTVAASISSLFTYDSIVNGVKFNLKDFNIFISKCSYKQSNIETTDGIKIVTAKANTVGILLMQQGITDKLLIRELGLNGKVVNLIPITKALPKDNPEKARKMLAQAQKERKGKIIISAIVGVIILILILAILL